jgi:hypothetical protein
MALALGFTDSLKPPAAGRHTDAWQRLWACSRGEAALAVSTLNRVLTAANYSQTVVATMQRLMAEALACIELPAWLVIHHRLAADHVDIAVENPGEGLIRLVLLRQGGAEWQRWVWHNHELLMQECRIIH